MTVKGKRLISVWANLCEKHSLSVLGSDHFLPVIGGGSSKRKCDVKDCGKPCLFHGWVKGDRNWMVNHSMVTE